MAVSLENLLMNDIAFVEGSSYRIYAQRSEDKDTHFKWFDERFVLERTDDICSFDKAYLRANHDHLMQRINSVGRSDYRQELESIADSEFISMFLEKVVPWFEAKRQKAHATEFHDLSISLDCTRKTFEGKDLVIIDGDCYPLEQKRWVNDYYIKVDGKRYALGPSGVIDKRTIIHDWRKNLDSCIHLAAGKISSKAKSVKVVSDKGRYHDSKKGIGYIKSQRGFLVYAQVPPYCLFESTNGKYYAFKGTRVGVNVLKSASWQVGNPVVVDKYTHPFLPHADEAMQEICLGPYLSQLQRMKGALASDQSLLPSHLTQVLEYSKNLLMKGYRPDVSGVMPWKTLKNAFSNTISKEKVGTEQRYKPTNTGGDWL